MIADERYFIDDRDMPPADIGDAEMLKTDPETEARINEQMRKIFEEYFG